jgi:O-antigen ligase
MLGTFRSPIYPSLSSIKASEASPSLGFVVWVILAYILATRLGGVSATKLGVEIGGFPLFLTEILISIVAVTLLISRFERLTVWLLSGWGAGVLGGFSWMLVVSALVHGALAFPEWKILALRDTAIFAYAVLFPLTYFALDTRFKARAALLTFIMAGCLLSVVLLIDAAVLDGALYGDQVRQFTAQKIAVRGFGGGDVGGMVSFSFVGLLALAARPRPIIFLGLFVCFIAFALGQTRSAVVGVALAGAFLLLAAPSLWRSAAIGITAFSLVMGAGVVLLLPGTDLGRLLEGFYLAVIGGIGLAEDDNVYFRLLRWQIALDAWLESPFFGVGFGVPLAPDLLISEEESGLNAGLPHNSYLTTLARMGVLGLFLVITPWVIAATRCLKRFAAAARADQESAAAGAILVAMAGYAGFVLFLERPHHGAVLWIMMAVAVRLSEPEDSSPR